MSSKNVQCFVHHENATEAHQRMSNEKMITIVQICLRCGRKFPLKRGRKKCPSCQGLLRNKTTILKVP